MTDELATRFAAYMVEKLDGIVSARTLSMERIHGGASRETYRVKLETTGTDGTAEKRLILRRDPTGSLIDTERQSEFVAYKSVYGHAIPVPKALVLELDASILDRPFFVMEEIEGCQAGNPFMLDPYGPAREKIGEQFWTMLGRIHARPVGDDLLSVMEKPASQACWSKELDYWEGVVDGDELEPHPLFRAAVRKLRRTPPPPPERVTLIHGDYRTGNFLFDDQGDIRAILDWEMAHLGDPHEDLAWALDPLWAFKNLERPGGMIDTDAAIAHWEAASGLSVDPAALKWWSLFAMVKGLAIWISSSKEFADGDNKDPILAFSGWYCTATHNVHLANRLSADFDTETAQ